MSEDKDVKDSLAEREENGVMFQLRPHKLNTATVYVPVVVVCVCVGVCVCVCVCVCTLTDGSTEP